MTITKQRIVAIDGPAGSGKTTLASRLAERFDLAFLDTGLLYRATARKLLETGTSAPEAETSSQEAGTSAPEAGVLIDEETAANAARSIGADDLDPTALMTEVIGQTASKVAAVPAVRTALLELQRRFGEDGKGAVLVGRDIGTIVRPDASHKIFVTASVEKRAERRCKQLQERGVAAIYDHVLEELCQRDARDQSRAVAPLVPAEDAFILDTTDQSIEMAFETASAFIAGRHAVA